MIKAMRIVLSPTREQECKFYSFSGATKFIYNWALGRWNELYNEWEEDNSKVKPSGYALLKELTQLKRQDGYEWLKGISSKTLQGAVLDLDTAFKNYFRGTASRPCFKGKRYNRVSFPTDIQTLYFKDGYVNIACIGKVKYRSSKDIPNAKYSNARVSYDGKYWYLSFGIECGLNNIEVDKSESLGIDLGVKDLAILSNGTIYKNINKTKEMRKLSKRLKRKQRQVSRKYELNKDGRKFVKTQNIKKLEKEIKLLHRHINNKRDNYIHNITANIVKLNPERVVMEDLNVSGMLKNKHLARAIQEQKLYDFKRILTYKCKYNQIELVEADRWYGSSKTCSGCGNVKQDLKLKDRVYKCDSCGLEIDRDLNAAINLSRYEEPVKVDGKGKKTKKKVTNTKKKKDVVKC